MKIQPLPDVQVPDRGYRPRATRVMTVLTTGKLILDNREALCRVRNLSTSGMKIETGAALQVGQLVRIGMRSGPELEARVAWARDGAAGLSLMAPMDVAMVLAAQPRASRLSRLRPARSPRLRVECAIEVEARGLSHHGMLRNLSQSGAGLRLPFRPARDERLILCIPGLPLKSGTVRWVDEAEAGLGFYEALPFEMLSTWIEAYAQADPK